MIAVAAVASADACGDRSAREVFESNSGALRQDGVRRVDRYAFSTVTIAVPKDASGLSDDIAREQAGLHAIRALLAQPLASVLGAVNAPPSLSARAGRAAIACIESTVTLTGLETVHEERTADGFMVCKALLADQIDRMEASPTDLVTCLMHKADAGGLDPEEAMLLLEILPEASEALPRAKAIVSRSLRRAYGPGIECAIDGSWPSGSLEDVRQATEMWAATIRASCADEVRFRDALAPLPEATLKKFEKLDINELLPIVGHRVHDRALLSVATDRLRESGWPRTAALLQGKPVAVPPLRGGTGSILSPDLRADVACTAVVTLALISGGAAPMPLVAEDESSQVADHIIAVCGRSDAASIADCVKALQSILADRPSARALAVLGAVLTACGESSIALPVCRSAFAALPKDTAAGVGLLRALRAVEDRAGASELLPRVELLEGMGDSGRAACNDIASWLSSGDQYPANR